MYITLFYVYHFTLFFCTHTFCNYNARNITNFFASDIFYKIKNALWWIAGFRDSFFYQTSKLTKFPDPDKLNDLRIKSEAAAARAQLTMQRKTPPPADGCHLETGFNIDLFWGMDMNIQIQMFCGVILILM